MRLLTWAVVAALVTMGCGDDDSSATPEPQARATVALADSIHFNDAEVQNGTVALATESRVSLLLASEQQVSPGQTGIMAFTVDNPIEDDNPTTAVLLQFGDIDKHLRVPETPDDSGEIALEFEIDGDLCANLCNARIEVPMTAALELDDGAISKHLDTTIVVDCREDGDPDACDDATGGMPDSGADGGSSGADRDGSVPVDPAAMGAAQDLIGSIADFTASLCACLPAGTRCMADPSTLDCQDQAVIGNAAGEAEWLECARTFYTDQMTCISESKCDPDALSACTMTTANADPWAAIEESCGAVPTSLNDAFAACEPADEPTSGLTSFPCSDGSMVDLAKLCDGMNDCPNGTDEMICANCSDGSGSFSSLQICDGKKACDDGSDEAGCMYPCANGEMIIITKLCNGTPDCSDGSDESLCNGSEYKCTDGSAIPIMKVCDGTRDCSDGGDEASGLCG